MSWQVSQAVGPQLLRHRPLRLGPDLPRFIHEFRREQFIARYMEELAAAYPSEADGRVLFLYPRLFIVATKPGG